MSQLEVFKRLAEVFICPSAEIPRLIPIAAAWQDSTWNYANASRALSGN